MLKKYIIKLGLALLLATSFAHAQEMTEAEQEQQIKAIMDQLKPQKGDITLLNGDVKLSLGEDYYFLDAAASKKVLVDLWGNMDDGEPVLGMIFPAKYTPLDAEGWGATLEYIDDGYVSDEDAASIDFNEMLKDMQDATREQNKARQEAGYESIELVGWAEPPYYDSATNKLYWAKDIKFGEAESDTLNYNIRVLGRRGYLQVNFIADIAQLPEINSKREEVLALTEFTDGSRYSDFDPSVDKVAAYGIGALVAGKLAAKAGLFAGLLLLLKKFGVFIVVGIGALFAKLFGKKD